MGHGDCRHASTSTSTLCTVTTRLERMLWRLWRSVQSGSNLSPRNFLLTGKNTGNFTFSNPRFCSNFSLSCTSCSTSTRRVLGMEQGIVTQELNLTAQDKADKERDFPSRCASSR